jgi:cytochrome oxidase Cu insertion factor (SCO1/SenC/PrrC family)
MLRKTVLAALVLALACPVAYAQLGPKDATNLKPADLERVKAGDAAPDFTLENTDGNRITLSEFRGKKSVILVFYRGQW